MRSIQRDRDAANSHLWSSNLPAPTKEIICHIVNDCDNLAEEARLAREIIENLKVGLTKATFPFGVVNDFEAYGAAKERTGTIFARSK